MHSITSSSSPLFIVYLLPPIVHLLASFSSSVFLCNPLIYLSYSSLSLSFSISDCLNISGTTRRTASCYLEINRFHQVLHASHLPLPLPSNSKLIQLYRPLSVQQLAKTVSRSLAIFLFYINTF